MSKPWSKIGAWAADVEAEEAEAAAAAATPADTQSFPSLREAATTKPKKKKMTLSEFYSEPTVGGGIGANRLTPDEMLRLPTGPKERSAEELQHGRLGGGFSSYGRSGPGHNRMRDRDDSDGSWGGNGRRSYGGFDDERKGPPSRAQDFVQSSRADEVDNWAMTKKPLPSVDSGRQNRYGSLSGGAGGPGSRADEVDNWAMGKKPVVVRSSTFGSGFRDSAPRTDLDRWPRGEGLVEVERERPRLVLNQRSGNVGSNEGVKVNNPFGAARPREDVLAEKGLDWKKLELELDAKKNTSRPTSAHSSRPSSSQSTHSESKGLPGIENVVKPKPKVNPFGDAKPREVLLQEKGMDWRKLDLELEHRGVDRSETEDEKLLKEELVHLKKNLEKSAKLQFSGEDQSNLQDIILKKERDLEMLIRDLDDKVRFGQKAIERPGSGAGRAAGFAERPPSSHSGSLEESISMEFVDRPRSRGVADDRRGYQGGRERGFLGNRNLDRPRSRDRW